MKKKDIENLESVYAEISSQLGIEVAKEIHEMFKGQQISFPVRFYSREAIHKKVLEEYDGNNVRLLAKKYNYSEKTIRRIIKENK